MKNLIAVENLGKIYRKSKKLGRDSVREAIAQSIPTIYSYLRSARNSEDENTFWALRKVNFEVNQGEVLGVIGNNGAGKTTLFRILSQITAPTEGKIKIRGRIGTMLGAASGFHTDLSGKENIFFAAAVMGMKTSEMKDRFDKIVEFSGISPFLNTAVKHYSAGMVMRLGFAIASHLLPDVLILDEILAVGDQDFQAKAIQRTREIAQSGQTILFVSHNLDTISSLCSRVLVLHKGEAIFFGKTKDGLQAYAELLSHEMKYDLANEHKRLGSGEMRCKSIDVDSTGKIINGSDVRIRLNYETKTELSAEVKVSIFVQSGLGEGAVQLSNEIVGYRFPSKISKRGQFVCRVPQLPLAPGIYDLIVQIDIADTMADRCEFLGALIVESDSNANTVLFSRMGGLLVPQSWSIEDA